MSAGFGDTRMSWTRSISSASSSTNGWMDAPWTGRDTPTGTPSTTFWSVRPAATGTGARDGLRTWPARSAGAVSTSSGTTSPTGRVPRGSGGRFFRDRSNPELVEVSLQVQGTLVHPQGARAFKLLPAGPAREKSHPERSRAPRGEDIPDAVADDQSVGDGNVETSGRREEEVGIGLRPFHVVARDHQIERREAKLGHRPPGIVRPRAGRDDPGDGVPREMTQQLLRSRKGSDLRHHPLVFPAVMFLDALDDLGGDLCSDLAQDRLGDESAAHADSPMDLPGRSLEPFPAHGVAPGNRVLVGAVDERAVEIEEEGRLPPEREDRRAGKDAAAMAGLLGPPFH